MNKSSSNLQRFSTRSTLPTRSEIIALSVGVVALLIGAYVLGSKMRAAAQASAFRDMQQAESAFCQTMGAGPGTENYGHCKSGLENLRQRHDQAIQSELLGFF